jgi:hypothetical protein
MKQPARSFYEVLGVEANATAAQLRDAYLLRSKVLHPDRFDPKAHSREWQLANDLFRELNDAYAVLRDAKARAEYDRNQLAARFARSTSSSMPPKRAGKTSVRVQPKAKKPPQVWRELRSGVVQFSELSAATQFRLKTREREELSPQLRIELTGQIGRLRQAVTRRTKATCLEHAIYITPLYVIYTFGNEVRYWPLSDVKDIVCCDRSLPWPSRIGNALLILRRDEFEVPHVAAAQVEELRQAVRLFKQTARLAASRRDRSYYQEHDDFAELKQTTNSAKS